MPIPFGAWNLWPDIASMSTGTLLTSTGILPATCTASVWKIAPRSLQTSAIFSTGKTVPVSLFAHIVETRTGRFAAFAESISAASWSRSICPTPLTGSSSVSKPSALSRRTGWRTAGCSTAVVITFRSLPNQSAVPRIAELSDSVAQEVKITSSGEQLRNAATSSLDRSTNFATCPPKACIELGLPYSSPRKGSITSRTSGAICDVALLSKYTVFPIEWILYHKIGRVSGA